MQTLEELKAEREKAVETAPFWPVGNTVVRLYDQLIIVQTALEEVADEIVRYKVKDDIWRIEYDGRSDEMPAFAAYLRAREASK